MSSTGKILRGIQGAGSGTIKQSGGSKNTAIKPVSGPQAPSSSDPTKETNPNFPFSQVEIPGQTEGSQEETPTVIGNSTSTNNKATASAANDAWGKFYPMQGADSSRADQIKNVSPEYFRNDGETPLLGGFTNPPAGAIINPGNITQTPINSTEPYNSAGGYWSNIAQQASDWWYGNNNSQPNNSGGYSQQPAPQLSPKEQLFETLRQELKLNSESKIDFHSHGQGSSKHLDMTIRGISNNETLTKIVDAAYAAGYDIDSSTDENGVPVLKLTKNHDDSKQTNNPQNKESQTLNPTDQEFKDFAEETSAKPESVRKREEALHQDKIDSDNYLPKLLGVNPSSLETSPQTKSPETTTEPSLTETALAAAKTLAPVTTTALEKTAEAISNHLADTETQPQAEQNETAEANQNQQQQAEAQAEQQRAEAEANKATEESSSRE